MSTAEVAKPVLPVLEDYAPIVGEPEILELRELARRLAGRRVKMVNSTQSACSLDGRSPGAHPLGGNYRRRKIL
jgi:hypothetical protein